MEFNSNGKMQIISKFLQRTIEVWKSPVSVWKVMPFLRIFCILLVITCLILTSYISKKLDDAYS